MNSNPYVTKVELGVELDKQNQKIDLKVNNLELGVNGSIDTTTDTTSLLNGFYFAETSGTYTNANNIVVTEGYYTILEKNDSGWKVASSVEMPMQDLTALENMYNASETKEGAFVNFTSRTLARSSVPNKFKKSGLTLTYLLNGVWVREFFKGNTLEDFRNLNLFESISKQTLLNYVTDVAETRLQIPLGDRKKGYVITYVNSQGKVITEMYNSTIYGDADWRTDLSWIQIEYSSDIYKNTIGELFSIQGYTKKIDGSLVEGVNYLRTDFLPISKLEPIIYSGYVDASVSAISFYDTNKKFVSSVNITGNQYDYILSTDEIPKNASYIIASTTKSFSRKRITGISLNSLNNSILKINSELKETHTKIIKNEALLHKKSFVRLTFTEEDGTINNTGQNADNAAFKRTPILDSIIYDSNKKYAFSGNITNVGNGGVYCYDSNDVFLGVLLNIVKVHENSEFTPIKGTYKMRFVALNHNQYKRGIYEVIEESIAEIQDKTINELSTLKFTEKTPNLSENGAFKVNGDIDSTQISYKRNQTGVVYSVILEDDIDYYYSGKIGSGYAGVLFYNEKGGRMNTDIFAGQWLRKKITKPFGAKYMSVSSMKGDFEIGIYKGDEVSKIDELFNTNVKRYQNFEQVKKDYYKKNNLSAVGSFTYNNLLDKVITDKELVNKLRIKSTKLLTNYLLWWDDFLGKGLFKGAENVLLESSDFESFTTLKTFTEGLIATARYTLDGKILVTIDGVGSTTGGIFKGDINGFTRVQAWSSDTVVPVEHWCLSMINNVIVANEYERSENTQRKTNCVYISFDNGDSFTKIFDFHDSDFYKDTISKYPDNAGSAHIHGCCYDSYENRVWLATGDKMNKWVLFSNPITDVNNVTWNGMYLDTQFCPLFATRNGIVAGCDHIDNAIYMIHRGATDLSYIPNIDKNMDKVHVISNDRTSINYVPGIITEINNIIFSPNNSWKSNVNNKISASYNGVDWLNVWESELEGGGNGNCKIFKYKSDYIIFEKNSLGNRIIIVNF